jgi:diadenosine tetraphosphate (Ap4A) HIT family hydrolase
MNNYVIEGTLISSEKRVRHNCPFCNIDKTINNNTHILDLDYGSLFLNYNQSYLGRCLYIPNNHFSSLDEISEDAFINFSKEVNFLAKNIQKLFNADLINIAMLGNKVNHIHWHLIPRYEGDENWGTAPWPMHEKNLSSSEIDDIRKKIKSMLINA